MRNQLLNRSALLSQLDPLIARTFRPSESTTNAPDLYPFLRILRLPVPSRYRRPLDPQFFNIRAAFARINPISNMLPHPTLAARYATPEAKPDYVNRLFDQGAQHYDAVVNWGFLHSGAAYRRHALKQHGLRPTDHLLDVACGTGLVAVEAAKILGRADNITCLDPSAGMLAVARTKLPAHFVIGRAEKIPLANNAFEFLTMGYALRHVTSLEETFGEYHRVLKPGGRLLILEVTKPTGRLAGFFFRLYFGHLYPFLTRLFTGSREAREMMRYYWETMDACVSPAAVLGALRNAGFTDVKRHVSLGLFSEYTATKA